MQRRRGRMAGTPERNRPVWWSAITGRKLRH